MLFPSLFPFLLTSGESDTTTYDEIRACGEVTLDEWSFYNTNISNTNIQNYATTGTPTWGVNTILLGHLDSNFDMGNFPESDKPITHWRILRKIYGTLDPFVEIGFIENTNVNIFQDARAVSNVSYVYAIQGVSNGTRGSAIFAEALSPDDDPLEAISVSFFGWKLTNISGDTVYSFYVDLQSDDITTNIGRTEYVSVYSRFPKVERGNLQYRTGRLNTRPFDEDGNGCYVFGNNASREQLEAFLMNKEPKILKNGSGLAMVIDVAGVAIAYDDVLFNQDNTQPYMISFDFVEIEDISNV